MAPLLENEGHAVAHARNGRDALEALTTNPTRWSLILLDLQMPVMDCAEFLSRVRGHPDPLVQEIPVVLHTSSAVSAATAQAAQGVLSKPCHYAQLLKTVSASKRLCDRPA